MPLIDMSECYQMTNVGDHIDGTDVYQSNRNLLDNPFFTVNLTSNVSGAFGAGTKVLDRWFTTFYTNTGSSWAITTDGIAITIATNDNVVLRQAYNPIIPYLNGKTVKFSLLLSDGTVYEGGAFTRISGTNQSSTLLTGAFIAHLRSNEEVWLQCLGGANGTTVRAIKLELGTVSTLANDAPPNYVEELHKCEAYYKKLGDIRWTGYGMALNNSQIRLCIPFSKMAKTPTSGIITTPKLFYNNAWTAASSYSVTDYDTSYIMFVINVSQTLTAGSSYLLQADNIQISADL